MADTLRLTPSESVTIRSSSAEMLEVEGRWGPGGKPPPAHYHPDQDEHFEVLEGRLTAKIDGEERELAAGDTLDVPRGTAHQMWNRSGEPARALWQTKPGGRTEEWFRSIDGLIQGEGGDRMPGPLAFAPYLSEYEDVIRLSAGPEFVTRPLIKALGRLRGGRPAT
jgi:mannose-6-phosphate isomerase-like protein (cupin superfamily)